MQSDSAENRVKESQGMRLDLLRTDLSLAFNFLRTASLTSSADHRDRAIQKARTALLSIRQLGLKLSDPEHAAEIKAGADKLEAAIASASL